MNSEQFDPPSTDVKEKVLKCYVYDFIIRESDDFPSKIMRYYADIPVRRMVCRTSHYSNPVFVTHDAYRMVRMRMSDMVEEIELERR